MPLRIVRNDITRMHTEAIVNTANDYATVGTGCDSAVYRAAGYEKLLAYRTEQIGFVPEGDAFITPGFQLSVKYIIHAVSPHYMGGNQGEEEKLRSCYKKSLQLAKKYEIASIAFPLISTGGFGYPKEEGMRIAVDEINAFLLHNEMEIFLVVFDEKAAQLGKKITPNLEAYIDRNYVEQAKEAEYGETCLQDMNQRGFGHGVFLSDTEKLEKCLVKKEKSHPASIRTKKTTTCGSVGAMPPNAAPQMEKSCASEDACEDECLDFEEKHERKLEERMKHLSDTYSEYLMYLIREKNLENPDVWKRAIVDKKIFSKIKNNVNYHPNKMTALCLCVGAKLNLDEARDLLARAGYALSPCDKTDVIFSYFIENGIYDMLELDIQLEEHGLPCIIS